MNKKELTYLQSLPLSEKIRISKIRIKQWYEEFEGQVYVSFSGGKDSTVLLRIVRELYPDIPAVFCDTGLEFPEIRSFVKSFDNLLILRPKKTYRQVIEQWGYPVISKSVSMAISRYRNTSDPEQKHLRLHGGLNPTSGKKQTVGVIPQKYQFLINAPFKISEYCCEIMKKSPLKCFNHKAGLKGMLGIMAEDSHTRKINFFQFGCNAFDMKTPQSRPLIFWTEKDVWQFLKSNNIPYCKIYDMGYSRTGCIFCMFGIVQEEKKHGTNRFKIMKRTHPQLWDYCMHKLGLLEVLNFCGISPSDEAVN